MTEHRHRCPRGHWQFSITPEGISYKCRAGECREQYVLSWEELEARRLEVMTEKIITAFSITPPMIGEITPKL